jgi:hypothetical protein
MSISEEKKNATVDASPVETRECANRNIAPAKGGLFRWFDPNDGPVERRLITKLDVTILGYACIGFWVSAISMKHDLC